MGGASLLQNLQRRGTLLAVDGIPAGGLMVPLLPGTRFPLFYIIFLLCEISGFKYLVLCAISEGYNFAKDLPKFLTELAKLEKIIHCNIIIAKVPPSSSKWT